jgi:hypothetical protein
MMLEDIMATEPDPRPGPALRGEPLSDQLLARLSGEAALWVDGGSIARWAPVYGRAAKPVAPTGQHGRFVFTRIAAPPVEGTIRRWVEHQRMLVRAEDGVSPQLVFWRLAARQRAFAIDAYPCVDVKTASDRVRGLAHRAAYLQVTLGFFAGETLPCWVVCDEETPVMVGMPHYHLVPTDDPAASLGALVGTARIKPQVHEVTTWP